MAHAEARPLATLLSRAQSVNDPQVQVLRDLKLEVTHGLVLKPGYTVILKMVLTTSVATAFSCNDTLSLALA